tara:strand:- start:956 stop:1846 length:891 start_codon:yes stop_codon:yes gene_type:complete
MSSVLINNEISMILNSNPADGAENLSPDGSLFQVNLEDGGIQIPTDAVNVTVSVESASVWFSTPNIISADTIDGRLKKNNVLYINAPLTAGGTGDVILYVEQGLYDLTALNEEIFKLINLNGTINLTGTTPKSPIVFDADAATGKVFCIFNEPNVTINFTPNDTFRDILGFNSGTITSPAGASQTTPKSVDAPKTARFNTLTSYLIHGDIVQDGIRFNNSYNQTLTDVIIGDAAPFEQINSTPFNPPKVSANELRGIKRNNLAFWITDQNDNRINMAGEYWNFRMVIRYNSVLVLK